MGYIGFLLFGLTGRITRRAWWLGVLLIFIATLALSLAAYWPMIQDIATRPDLTEAEVVDIQRAFEPPIWFFVVYAGIFYLFVAISVKRLRDRDWSPMFIGGIFLAYVAVTALGIFVSDPSMGQMTEDEARAYFTQYGQLFMVYGFLAFGVSLFLLIDNGFMPGTPGHNQHGPDPRVG